MNGAAIKTRTDAEGLIRRLETDGKGFETYEKNGMIFVLSAEGLPPYAGDYGVLLSREAVLFVVEYTDACRMGQGGRKPE